MRSMTMQETVSANGGFKDYVECDICGKKFWYSYFWIFTKAYNRGLADNERTAHIHSEHYNW